MYHFDFHARFSRGIVHMPRDVTASVPAPSFRTMAAWTLACVGASLLSTFAFACVTPLAGLAAIAGLKLPRNQALAVTGLTWFANQAVGFLFLQYPLTADCFAWGGLLAAAALAGTLAANSCARMTQWALRLGAGFLAAFAVYEIILFAATPFLGGEATFAGPILLRILAINLAAFLVLAALSAIDIRARTVALLPSRG
jgi:hypothetical protein